MEKNLQDQEALRKFKELAEDINVCMFITDVDEESSTRPMATIKAEDDGTLWFFTHLSSGKTSQLREDQDVHLVYAHPGKSSYMDVWGKGSVITDKNKIKELWSPIVKAWFPGGVDDPDICLLKVNPHSAYYWDAEAGRMVSFLKILASAVSGKKFSEGAEGSLEV